MALLLFHSSDVVVFCRPVCSEQRKCVTWCRVSEHQTVGVAGTELFYYMLPRPQDQYDQIAVHTQKGIDFLEKYGHFVDARTKIEQEYASKLR